MFVCTPICIYLIFHQNPKQPMWNERSVFHLTLLQAAQAILYLGAGGVPSPSVPLLFGWAQSNYYTLVRGI